MILRGDEWLHFVEQTGSAGVNWAQEYRKYSPALEKARMSILLLRRGQLREGEELMWATSSEIDAYPVISSSIKNVLDRYRYGLEAYYFYHCKNYTKAREALSLAHIAVACAVSTSDCLTLLAVDCQEFCLHEARIARNQRRWAEMHYKITSARAMMEGSLPLCIAGDDRSIWWSDVEAFLAKYPAQINDHQHVASTISNKVEREKAFNGFVKQMITMHAVNVR